MLPVSQSIVGSWALTAERVVTMPKNGGAPTTSNTTVAPDDLVMAYAADGRATRIRRATTPEQGSYTYVAPALTIVISGRTTAVEVTELTATRLETVSLSDDAVNSYTTTDTFIR